MIKTLDKVDVWPSDVLLKDVDLLRAALVGRWAELVRRWAERAKLLREVKRLSGTE